MKGNLEEMVSYAALEALKRVGGEKRVIDVSVSNTYMKEEELVTNTFRVGLIQLSTGEYVIEEVRVRMETITDEI